MGIGDFIQRKKEQFFVARDADKLELQKANLLKQREESNRERQSVEEIRKLQSEINANQNAIHEARTAGSRGVAQKIGGGFKSFASGAQKFDKNIQKFSGTPNPNSPFHTGGVMGSSPVKEKKSSGKTIHIHFSK